MVNVPIHLPITFAYSSSPTFSIMIASIFRIPEVAKSACLRVVAGLKDGVGDRRDAQRRRRR
jgi:hypothetical protein